MSFYRQTVLALAATTLVAGVPAMAQETQVSHAESRSVTSTPIKGHHSVNKRHVVHIKKHVIVPAKAAAQPAPGSTMTTTKTTTAVHKSSSSSGQ